ncbi:GYD domain-containing protein [candidate division GN15 bacterium]|nr:GYD domain-containing protein [candidate division GN15 bacterium]
MGVADSVIFAPAGYAVSGSVSSGVRCHTMSRLATAEGALPRRFALLEGRSAAIVRILFVTQFLIGRSPMASFIMAMSINPHAKKTHADLSHQVDESLKIFEKHGVKVAHLYATMGRYDCVAIFDTNDHSIAFRVASEITNLGILDTETWPVIPFDEFTQLIS